VLKVYITLFRCEMQRSDGLNFSTWDQIHIEGHVIPWPLTGRVSFYLEDGQKVHRRMRFHLFTFLTPVCAFFCHFIWTASKIENTEHIKYPETDPKAVSPNEKTTQLVRRNSSAGLQTREQPQHVTSSSSETHNAFPFRTPTAVLGSPISPQITHEGDVSEVGYHAKSAAPHSSSEGDVTRLELERQVSVLLAAQAERDQRIVRLTDELALKSTLLEQAEANATEAAKRAGLELREHADRLLMQSSRVKQRDAVEFGDMQAKPLSSRDQQIEQYEKELANARVKLEAKESEMEAVRLRLADAEKGWIKSKAEADALRTQTATGFVNRDEDQVVIRRLMERVRAIEAEIASMRWNEKGFEAMECRNEG
jgi:hypothetical protein